MDHPLAPQPELVFESILNAPAIYKVLRSHDPLTGAAERLYVIKGLTFDGLGIYTKGKFLNKEGIEVLSLYPQKETQISEPFPCAECGAVRVVRTVEDCRMSDGFEIKELSHYKCEACNARFFDRAAVHRIQAERKHQASSHTS